MAIKERISDVCHDNNRRGNGVLAPHACLYCFGCPIATLVVGVSGRNYQTGAIPVTGEIKNEINAWLDKIVAE